MNEEDTIIINNTIETLRIAIEQQGSDIKNLSYELKKLRIAVDQYTKEVKE